jgi:stringent starvation protein B
MPDGPHAQRLQEIFTALVQKSISDSLARVELAIAAWRRGERNVLAAHAEVLRHTARTNVLSNRIARAALEGPDTLLRDALDAGVIDRGECQRLTGRDPDTLAPSPSLDEEAARAAGPEMPAKKSTMEKLLRDGPVLVHLDPRRAGVEVPAQHRGEPRLVLRFGYGLSPPIADLAVEEQALAGTLTFRGVPFRCVVPWSAVYAVVGEDGRGLVWSEDVPPEIAHEYARDARGQTARPDATQKGPEATAKSERPARPRKERPDPADKADKGPPDKPEPPEPDGPKPRRGHLKLV